MSDTPTAGVRTAFRALKMVEFVAAHAPVSFGALLEELSLPRSTAHGLLQTLVASGWLAHDRQSRTYSLGIRAWEVGQQYQGSATLPDLARPIMDGLRDRLGETVQLAQLDGTDNVYVAISQPKAAMRLVSSVGLRLEAHATGIGKALLSMLDPAEADRRLRTAPLTKLTEHTVSDPDELLELLERVRRDGYALDDEEYISGCRCVGVPLTSEDEVGVFSALSVTMPTSRTTAAWPSDLLGELVDAANQIRGQLGLPPRALPAA